MPRSCPLAALSICLFFLLGTGMSAHSAESARKRAEGLSDFVAHVAEQLRESPRALELGPHELFWPGDQLWQETGDPVPAPSPRAREATSDWTPYTGPFDTAEAAHLLHRGVIGPRFDEILNAAGLGLDATVQDLLSTGAEPPAPGSWATEPFPDINGWTQEQIDSLVVEYGRRMELLRYWWADVMLETGGIPARGPSVRESMVLFWHDHFATGGRDVILPQSMYVQNRLLRTYAVGNFRELVKRIYKDPAMLLWLNGQENYADHINENFARELLELFTLGLDQYSQDDIVAAAKAFTGWITEDGLVGTFHPELHDYSEKTFLEQTGAWFGHDIVDIIFQQDETARFLCRKLYRWFIDEYPDEILIEDLAQTLRTNDYEIQPVLDRLFRSEHFFDANFRGSILSDGIDRSVGLLRSLYLEDLDLMGGYDEEAGPTAWTGYSMLVFGHYLLDPPNVAGWPGYRSWINATTLTARKALDVSVIDGDYYGYDLGMQADALLLASEMTNPEDPLQLVDDFAVYLFGLTPTEAVRQRMIDELLQGEEPWEWSLGDPEAESQVQGLLRLMLRLPDFQLK